MGLKQPREKPAAIVCRALQFTASSPSRKRKQEIHSLAEMPLGVSRRECVERPLNCSADKRTSLVQSPGNTEESTSSHKLSSELHMNTMAHTHTLKARIHIWESSCDVCLSEFTSYNGFRSMCSNHQLRVSPSQPLYCWQRSLSNTTLNMPWVCLNF